MNRCSFREWIPILPWPVWPLAGQCLLGQKTVVGSMRILLLAVRGNIARRSMSGPRFLYNFTTPRLGVELPPDIGVGDTFNMLRRLMYTTPIIWGTKQRPDGSFIYDPETIEMVLATAYKVSDDRQMIEFTLRNNAKFANGDPLNAQALKDSYAWFLGARGSGQLRVNGLPSAEHIEVVDDVTVRLHLDRPVAWGLIGNALLSSSSMIHAKEILKHATADDPYGARWLETKTIESGPFVIETWQKGTMMSLVPNPHGFQPSQLERIILQVVPDASTRRIVLERGDVDFAVYIAPKDIADLRKVSGVKVASYPSARGWWLGMTWR